MRSLAAAGRANARRLIQTLCVFGTSSMNKCIAERKLLYAEKGSDDRKELIIRIGAPYVVDQNEVNFPVGEGVVGCTLEFDGLTEISTHEAYGVDSLQAIQLAVDVEPILEKLSGKYDFYFPTGESYFES